MNRQTTYTLDELTQFIETGTPELGIPDCLAYNEIGQIARGNTNEASEAQRVLVKLLLGGDDAAQFICLCFLLTMQRTEQLTGDSHAAVSTFIDDPANADLVGKVFQRI